MGITEVNLDKLMQQYRQKRMDDSEYRAHLLDISNYIAPKRGRFLNQRDMKPGNKGSNRRYIFDDTASRAYGITAAGMKGGLCPHSLPWFKLSLFDDDLLTYAPVMQWLDTVQKKIYGILSGSNFYSAATSVFNEQVLFGTAPMAIDEQDKNHIICRSWTAGEYTLISDATGQIRMSFREFFMSPSSVAEEWGIDSLSEPMKKGLEDDPYQKTKVIHAIYDRFVRDASMFDNKNMPVASIFWDASATGKDALLHEGGYNSMPVMFPRWSQVAEDDYGSDCPAMVVLNDVRSLQEMKKDMLTLVKKDVAPAMIAPAHLKGRLKNYPNAINYVTDPQSLIRRMEDTNPNYQALIEERRDLRDSIGRGFYNDLFLMILNDKNMTATEVAQRHEDKLTILGSVIERQNSEFLSLSIERVFDIGMEKMLFPKPPPEIAGSEIKIDFVSMLAQAQRMVGTQSIERSMGFVASAAELKPEVLDVYDFDAAVRKYAEMQGADPDIMIPEKDVTKIRAARAQAQAQQAQAENDLQAAQASNIASQTELGKNSLLDKVMGS